jgi:hypothetical protein
MRAASAGGVGEFRWCCEWTEGVEGVWMRWTGGACEWAMGGVWPRARLMGGIGAAMCRCDETTTGEAWGWNWRGGMAY